MVDGKAGLKELHLADWMESHWAENLVFHLVACWAEPRAVHLAAQMVAAMVASMVVSKAVSLAAHLVDLTEQRWAGLRA